jgi:cellulose synthase (UDP-forming)
LEKVIEKDRTSAQQTGVNRPTGNHSLRQRRVGRLAVPIARFAILFTIMTWIVHLFEQGIRLESLEMTVHLFAESTLYIVTITMLTLSCLAYLVSRLGNYERVKAHRRVARSTIEDDLDGRHPSLIVLVPSYREQDRVNRYTLLSAGLQEYPELKVVLLIDDPPDVDDPEHRALLGQSRQLAGDLNRLLELPYLKFVEAMNTFEKNGTEDGGVAPRSLKVLADLYDEAGLWFEQECNSVDREDHVDDFFALNLLGSMAHDMRTAANALREAAADPEAYLTWRRVKQLYARLVNIFQAEFSSFERKRFAALSHESSKAMNLNSYIGLMGGSYCKIPSGRGPLLIPAGNRVPDLVVPDSEYLLTLDADSILLPEYCLRLVHLMEQADHAGIAVAQTPYASFPGASSKIELMSGATTDVQHLVHQGLEKHNAAFWVGANAVIRKSALMELETQEDEGGFIIRRFINDRTVIEDTQSSIDLRLRGWKIYNYPERLSYSATPPDFGTLAIQRQRWANGGLIIFPMLVKLFTRNRKGAERISILELLLRATYLASIGWSSLSLCVLFFYPFDAGLLSITGVLTALPYFVCMTLDLGWLGYRKRDIFKIYGLNLLLLPINIVGTIQSIAQIIGGHKIAFARTPKIQNRTVGPLIYLLVPIVLMVWSVWTLRNDVIEQDLVHLLLTLTNVIVLTYSCVVFIGVKQFIVDIYLNLKNYMYISVPGGSSEEGAGNENSWATVLYVGSTASSDGETTEIAFTQATLDYLDKKSESTDRVVEVRFGSADRSG